MVTGEQGRSESANAWHAMLSAVDSLCQAERASPPGSVARMHRALDQLRCAIESDAHDRHCATLVVTTHRLQSALLTSERDPVGLRGVRRDLRHAAQAWLRDTPVLALQS